MAFFFTVVRLRAINFLRIFLWKIHETNLLLIIWQQDLWNLWISSWLSSAKKWITDIKK